MALRLNVVCPEHGLLWCSCEPDPQLCDTCWGDGYCRRCDGYGQVWIPVPSDGAGSYARMSCADCTGSGRCVECRGVGAARPDLVAMTG